MNVQVTSATVNMPDIMAFIRELQDIQTEYDVTIQALDADLVAGPEHILFATEKAIRSWNFGKAMANDLGMEILLYASGNRQISRALEMGVHTGDNRVALVIASDARSAVEGSVQRVKVLVEMMGGRVEEENSEGEKDGILAYIDDKKIRLQSFFNITDLELEAAGAQKICDLVLERVAMVDVMK